MTTVEFLQIKFKELLGNKYLVFGNEAFSKLFTNSVPSPYGEQMTVDFQAFDQYGDVIVAVVSASHTSLTSVPFKLSNDRYTVSFWVPTDHLKFDSSGVPLADPKFTFYADMEKLAAALNNKRITYPNFNPKYQAYFTMSDPFLAGNQLERSGSYARVMMQITGNVFLSDIKVGTGADTRISVEVDGAEVFFENITELDIVANSDGNTIQSSTRTATGEDVAATAHQIKFAVDDYENGNQAMALLRRKVFRNTELLTPGAALPSNRRKVHTKLYKGEALEADFWGILAAEYSAGGIASPGKYIVSIVNSNKE